jgi:hypothetical protein
MTAIAGDPATPANEADLSLKFSATDVRNKSDLSDYTGELKVTMPLRITDRDSGPDLIGTTQDSTYSFAIPCTATTATNVGSTCTLTTTTNSLVPNTIKESVRSVWQLGKVDVMDGGADGVASTDPNTRYLTQGYFVP